MTEMAQRQEVEQPVLLAALFTGFLIISVCGIGGGSGLVWARRIAVETRRWISDRDFADIVSLCQFMPGPNIVGIAVCVGAKTPHQPRRWQAAVTEQRLVAKRLRGGCR